MRSRQNNRLAHHQVKHNHRLDMMKLGISILLLIFSAAAQANNNGVDYLDAKTAFCYSDTGLAKYLKFAQARNINGLNDLVLSGECDFVPDGNVVRLDDYQDDKIGSMPVISFEVDQQVLWTFKKFVQRTEFN